MIRGGGSSLSLSLLSGMLPLWRRRGYGAGRLAHGCHAVFALLSALTGAKVPLRRLRLISHSWLLRVAGGKYSIVSTTAYVVNWVSGALGVVVLWAAVGGLSGSSAAVVRAERISEISVTS
jgi:hypothetical protein